MVEMEIKVGCCTLVLMRDRSYTILDVTILTGYRSRISLTVLQMEMASLHLTSLLPVFKKDEQLSIGS